MSSTQDVRTLFLEEFVKRLIIRSLPSGPGFDKGADLFEKLSKASTSAPKIEITKDIPAKPESQKTEVKKMMVEAKKESPKVEPVNIEEQKPQLTAQEKILQPLAPGQNMPIATPASSETQTKPSIPIMTRLNPIIADPAVQIINCPGPDKNISITRMGAVQTLQISFTTNEINDFMKDISDKTKIPLYPGLFKVVFQNIIITAVISDFIGTKFMIEKRPMQTLPALPIKAQFA